MFRWFGDGNSLFWDDAPIDTRKAKSKVGVLSQEEKRMFRWLGDGDSFF